MTFRPEYVSSGTRNGKQLSHGDGEHLTSASENGEHQAPTESGNQGSSSIESGEHGSSSDTAYPRRSRRLRESRKNPFSASPTSRSDFSFPRQYVFDDEMDAVLETQRLEDAKVSIRDDQADQPKRKRENLSDSEHRLAQERED